MPVTSRTCVYAGEALARYGFGAGHPFGNDRLGVFWDRMLFRGLDHQVVHCEPVLASEEAIRRFHTAEYVARVRRQSATGDGYLDYGDTPAFPGVFEAASYVVGSVLDALERIMEGQCRRAFVPIAGLHHASRDSAEGFCVFNDCGVAIETLRSRFGVRRVAYVDIDAHHGNGVYYAFEDDADLIFADLHEDGHYLYPGTGMAHEEGTGDARGTKLNIPMPPNAGDDAFMREWERVEALIRRARPGFILFQCGADSLAGDPITHLRYSVAAHTHAARRLCELAESCCAGRLLAMGGGGYNRTNLARAWTAVVEEFVAAPVRKAPP
jgi:acetoin utilization protein AcuC